MINYNILGYDTLEDYIEDFNKTLLSNNHTFDYFVNWSKVVKNVKEHLVEISILNSLTKIDKKDIETEFKKIITKYPEVVPILPNILAIRYNKRDIKVDIIDTDFLTFDFNKDNYNREDILYFSKKTGLLNLFDEINDLYSYILGLEVGIDTNARKNRSSTSFKYLIENKFKNMFKDTNYNYESNFHLRKSNYITKCDFLIKENNQPKLFIFSNFYSSSGGKPKDTVNRYTQFQKELENSDLEFIWITDGLGWSKMKKVFEEGIRGIDYIINYNMMDKSIKNILY